MKEYICINCENKFTTEKKDRRLYCPNCGRDNLNFKVVRERKPYVTKKERYEQILKLLEEYRPILRVSEKLEIEKSYVGMLLRDLFDQGKLQRLKIDGKWHYRIKR